MRKQMMRQMKRAQQPSQGGGMQAQLQAAMQEQVAKLQDELAGMQVEGVAGQGAVKVTVNGQRDPLAVKIDKSVVDPEDVELLEDLILTALKDALEKAQELEQTNMAKMAGGFLPPGMSLPGL
ncbi:MAG TPA: YbaB/EbfC family nucleoid-associated protein [Candidatus Xenobia bacterium]|jgi:hypothetical protein